MTNNPQPSTKAPSVHLNWQDWLSYLEDADVTDAEKQQLIEAVWSITLAFVDFGIGISPKKENRGQNLDLSAVCRAAVVNSKQDTKEVV